MRPLPGDDAYPGRSRSSSGDNDATPLGVRTQPPQMTYFLADEKSMDASLSNSPIALHKQRESKASSSSNYGVESLETPISSISLDSDGSVDRVRKARRNWKKNLGQQMSMKSEEDLESLSGGASPSMGSFADAGSRNISPSHQRRASQATISRPYTPLSFGSPAPRSLGSSDSRRNSDAGSYTDEVASQAIVSSDEEETNIGTTMVDSSSASQLVMPSIRMPSRRPFTEKGKNLGKLKVLIAGDSGIGKSSLIKAIVQTCEDIVHVDPLTTSVAIPETRRKSRTKSRSGSSDMQATSEITEVYASTRSYPGWWSDLEDSRVLRRRKSMGDSVLERNLCFVDTPGYGNKTSCLECITPVVEYIESHFKKASSLDAMNESDMVNMLSGNGGSQVDLVLYVISGGIKSVDIEYLQRLVGLTNVVPLIAQADSLSPEELSTLKENISSELRRADVQPFQFALSSDSIPLFRPSISPYAISTRPSKDLEDMDASLLMSPDYIQPLVDSDLPILVSQIFDRDNIAYLRHSAARKFIQWRAASTPVSRPQGLYRPLTSGTLIHSNNQVMNSSIESTNYSLARITDHTQREERIAQLRLASWAADLQCSLHNERMRFDSLARSERAVWLTERLGECVQDGTIVPISQAQQKKHSSIFDPESNALVKKGTYFRQRNSHGINTLSSNGMNPNDPLGLLQLSQELRIKTWFLVKIMGGFGILGGFAYWLTRGFQGQDTLVWGMGGLTVRDLIDFSGLDWTT